MLTTIQIAGLQTFGYHGLFEEERRLGQKFTFDIDATLKAAPTHRDDRLDASIRYDAVVDAAVSLAGATKYQTLEALGEAVAIGLLRRFALIDTITVGVAKFSPADPAYAQQGRDHGAAGSRRSGGSAGERGHWKQLV